MAGTGDLGGGRGGGRDVLPTQAILKSVQKHGGGANGEENDEPGWIEVLWPSDRVVGAALFVGLGLGFWQQASGSEAAVYYSPHVLEVKDGSTLQHISFPCFFFSFCFFFRLVFSFPFFPAGGIGNRRVNFSVIVADFPPFPLPQPVVMIFLSKFYLVVTNWAILGLFGACERGRWHHPSGVGRCPRGILFSARLSELSCVHVQVLAPNSCIRRKRVANFCSVESVESSFSMLGTRNGLFLCRKIVARRAGDGNELTRLASGGHLHGGVVQASWRSLSRGTDREVGGYISVISSPGSIDSVFSLESCGAELRVFDTWVLKSI